MSRDGHSCSHWLRLRNPPPPRIWAHIRGALLVSQERRHLLVTPCPPHSSTAEQVSGRETSAFLIIGLKQNPTLTFSPSAYTGGTLPAIPLS
jgi:hypothetical protein